VLKTKVVALTLSFAAVLAAAYFWVAEFNTCGNEIMSELTSPDGAKKLVVFKRDCGATTPFSTQASIIPANARLPNESGNLFISDTDRGAAPSGPTSGPGLQVIWENSRSVVLSYHPKTRVFKAQDEVSGVRVRYATSP
jgi:hypothetical protein